MSYSMLLRDYLLNIGKSGSIDTNVISFFNQHLSTRYQEVLSSFSSWKNQQTQTAVTTANQQYYSYPPGVVNIESATVTQGTIVYPVKVVNSQTEWNYINQYPNTNTMIPQFIFPRSQDFGIWPIPVAANTLTLTYIYTTIPLNQVDYFTGTTTVTNNSVTVTSSGADFTTSMIGRYYVLTDSSGNPIDFWYKIVDVDSGDDELTLQSFYEGLTAATQNYLVAQVPDLPDEAHILLSWGTTADWFAQRGDTKKASEFNNMFYTGDAQNSKREGIAMGGLLGIRDRYAERSDSKIVTMNKKSRMNYYINWTNSITSS